MLTYMLMLLAAAAIAALVYRYDRYDREPWLLVLLTIGAGFLMMMGVGQIENAALRLLALPRDAYAQKAILVAVVEDAAKLLVVLAIARLAPKWFNDPLDGIIYGTLAGLGAGIEESLLYLSLSPLTLSTAGAEVTRLFAHALMGGLAGFAVGLGARPDADRKPRPLLVAACLALSVAVHFAWHWIAYQPKHVLTGRAAVMALMLALLIIWGVMVRLAARKSRRIFGRLDRIRHEHAVFGLRPARAG
jgi:RsiW-degrading membrane proteinase PrsW (M82 family)